MTKPPLTSMLNVLAAPWKQPGLVTQPAQHGLQSILAGSEFMSHVSEKACLTHHRIRIATLLLVAARSCSWFRLSSCSVLFNREHTASSIS